MAELREFAGILGAALIRESWHEGPATRVSQLLRRLGQACLEAAKEDEGGPPMTTDKQTVEVGQQAMTDERKESGLVERLRPFLRHTNLCAYKRFADRDNVCRCGLEEAVGEIAALIARDTEIERLREVLRRLVELDSDGEAGCAVDPIEYGEALNAARALNRQETDNA